MIEGLRFKSNSGNLGTASRSGAMSKKSKFPKFKKKNKENSFTLDAIIHVFEDKIQLPKIGKIKLKEKNYIPLGSPKTATISQKAGRWFVSVRYEVEIPNELIQGKKKPEKYEFTS